MSTSISMSPRDLAFNSWLAMMRRCYLSADSGFDNYGGRGITVCERWFDWRNFLADMGDRTDGLSLDRIDHDGSYEPSNCRWADVTTQNRNTRRNVTVEVGGVSMLACDAARLLGIPPATLSRRRIAGAALAERRPLKLVSAQVLQIKARLQAGDSGASIARDFGISRTHVYQIRVGKVWRALA